MRSIAVIGLGFGDEGKGRVVDYLARLSPRPIVARFTGAHQAAHHVITEDGRDHVFAHYGSGSFRDAPTWWSRHCPMSPVALLNERLVLIGKGLWPVIYIDGRSPVTTPYEVVWNESGAAEGARRHGSCGKGIFATLQRERDHFHILAEDLRHPSVLQLKLDLLGEYYGFRISEEFGGTFLASSRELSECSHIIVGSDSIIPEVETLIFENSQGLLLDEEYGFFPHVTPSQTGTQRFSEWDPEIWLVTRAYQTRHGPGPMAKEVWTSIPDNPYEMNTEDGPQGEFRRTLLDLGMLRYAVEKDSLIRQATTTLVITCMDLVQSDMRLQDNGKVIECGSEAEFVGKVKEAVGASKVMISRKPAGEIEVFGADGYG